MSDKKILMVLTSHGALGNTGKTTGFYVSEASHPYDVFVRQAGYSVDLVSPQGGEPPRDGEDSEDTLNQTFLDEMADKLAHTMTPDQVNPDDYDAIFYAGGHGTMWDFPENEALARIAASIYGAGGVVGAVCHGPAALVNIKLSDGSYLVDGKIVSSFTNEEEKEVGLADEVPFLLESKLVERGAEFRKSPKFEPHVETSERLVTGQNPASAHGVATQMWALLENVNRDMAMVP
ncbi:MAG: type 1 glutamine amidotransferase domain-containing protein [Cyanobacteria bacterium P01_D01_bin.2]